MTPALTDAHDLQGQMEGLIHQRQPADGAHLPPGLDLLRRERAEPPAQPLYLVHRARVCFFRHFRRPR